MSDQQYVTLARIPQGDGSLKSRVLWRGPLDQCQEKKQNAGTLQLPNGEKIQMNAGFIEIITAERYAELRKDRLV